MENGEMAWDKTHRCQHDMEGYNFEDAVIMSELVKATMLRHFSSLGRIRIRKHGYKAT